LLIWDFCYLSADGFPPSTIWLCPSLIVAHRTDRCRAVALRERDAVTSENVCRLVPTCLGPYADPLMTAALATIFVAVLTLSVAGVAEEPRPSVEGPKYGACVAQHPNDFRGVCAELRRAFKAETIARHGYEDETIADPPVYCRGQVSWQIERLVEAMQGDPEYQAMVRNNFGTMYSQCIAYAVSKNSDPEMLKNRKMNEDNAECMAQATENAYLGRIRTPNEFYTQCMAALGWPGQWLQ